MKKKIGPQISSQAAEISILVIDQDEINQYLLECLFTDYSSIKLFFVNNKEKASTFLSSTSPDIIIIEPFFLKGNGFEIIKSLKQSFRKVPFIALTVYALNPEKVKCFESGCDFHLSKPLNFEALLSIIDRIKPIPNYLSN